MLRQLPPALWRRGRHRALLAGLLRSTPPGRTACVSSGSEAAALDYAVIIREIIFFDFSH